MENIIEKIGPFYVLRGDKILGGIKKPILEKMLSAIEQNKLVYAADLKGYAGYALGLAAQNIAPSKEVHLIISNDCLQRIGYLDATSLHIMKTVNLPNVACSIVFNETSQGGLYTHALDNFTHDSDAHIFDIGFRGELFSEKFKEFITEIKLREFIIKNNVPEIWMPGGSGTFACNMQKLFPTIEQYVVDLGLPHGNLGNAQLATVNEQPNEIAKFPPHWFPTAHYYGAKTWKPFFLNAQPDALFINIAGYV